MTVGSRLKEERIRLRYSQTDFAGLAGVKKGTQISWEKDASSPSAQALVAFSKAGADALYILTGKRVIDPPLSEDDKAELLLDEVQDYIVNPNNWTRIDKLNEKELFESGAKILNDIVSPENIGNISEENAEKAKNLLGIIENENRRNEFRAACFAQRQREEDKAREGLEFWFQKSPYRPSSSVLKMMAKITVDFGVYNGPLVELVQEVFRDAAATRLRHP